MGAAVSASEKLRALAAMQQANPHVFVAQSLAPALPQIVAVVETAEVALPVLNLALRQSGINATAGHMLAAALAALEEALS